MASILFFLPFMSQYGRAMTPRKSFQWLCLPLVIPLYPSPFLCRSRSYSAVRLVPDFLIRQLKVSRLVDDLRAARNLSLLLSSLARSRMPGYLLNCDRNAERTERTTKSSWILSLVWPSLIRSFSLSLTDLSIPINYFSRYKLPSDAISADE